MSTILKEIKICGNGLMSNTMNEVILKPSNEKGIRFHLAEQIIEANTDNVVSTEHCVVLGKNNAKIMLIEHFMAALALLKINSLDIYLTNFEMPILDGSSKVWVEKIKEAGVEDEKDKESEKKYILEEVVYYENGKTSLTILPAQNFQVTYAVNFNHPDLKNRWASLTDNFDEVCDARTFGYLKELKMLQSAGYALGVSLENTVGLTEEGTYTTELRSEFEPVKHKILDILGDFYLTGINPLNMKVNVIVKEAGHAVHVKVAKILKDKLKEE